MRPASCSYRVYASHFAISNLEDLVEVIDVRQNKSEIAELPCSLQKIDAAAAEAGVGRRTAPSPNHFCRQCGSGRESQADQRMGDPRATDLVLFPKLALSSSAD
jgi:hypothetical protein